MLVLGVLLVLAVGGVLLSTTASLIRLVAELVVILADLEL
jgi:hypothetical protein